MGVERVREVHGTAATCLSSFWKQVCCLLVSSHKIFGAPECLLQSAGARLISPVVQMYLRTRCCRRGPSPLPVLAYTCALPPRPSPTQTALSSSPQASMFFRGPRVKRRRSGLTSSVTPTDSNPVGRPRHVHQESRAPIPFFPGRVPPKCCSEARWGGRGGSGGPVEDGNINFSCAFYL